MATQTTPGGNIYDPLNGVKQDEQTALNRDARDLATAAVAAGAADDATNALQTANSYAGQIAQANTTAGSAVSIAEGAEAAADNAVSRVEELEILGGVAPGDPTDATIALHMQQPGSQTETALNAQNVQSVSEGGEARVILNQAFVGASFSRRLATLGDSLIDMDSYQSDRFYRLGTNAAGWISHANGLLGWPLQTVYSGGQPGKQSNLFRDLIPELLTTNPDTVLVGPPTNDLLQGAVISTIRDRMQNLINLLRPHVGRIIVMTALPSNNLSAGWQVTRRMYNTWITEVARTQDRLTLFDPNRYVENVAANGTWAAGMTYDGVHTTEGAGFAMGRALADVLRPFVVTAPLLWSNSADSTNALTNGIPAGIYGTKGNPSVTGDVCNNWTVVKNGGAGAGAVLVSSVIPREDGIQGSANRMVVSGGGGDFQIEQTGTIAAGEIRFYDIEFSTPGDWTGPKRMQAVMEFYNASDVMVSAVPMNHQPTGSSALTRSPKGRYRFRSPAVTVPVGVVKAKVLLRFAMDSGTIDFEGATLRSASFTGPQ